MDGTILRRLVTRGPGVLLLGLVLAVALILVGWLDYSSTRRELLGLLRSEAASLRDTVAAAARSNDAAARSAEAQLTTRLLDSARLLAELDRERPLAEPRLQEFLKKNELVRVLVLAPDGSREIAVPAFGGGPGPGQPGLGSARGAGRPPWAGAGGGPGGPGSTVADRLLSGGVSETTTGVHEGRGGSARLAAGVRRANGGAIVLTVDASAVAELHRQSSLERLFDDIVASVEHVAYVEFTHGDVTRAHGEPPTPDASLEPEKVPGSDPTEQWFRSTDGTIMEVRGPIEIGPDETATLKLGLRLDSLKRAERRTLGRLAVSLTGAVVLGALGFGLVWLRRAYGSLTEEHARAQEALRRRDRLAAMGELASSVAHEIRNPLNAIAMSAQRLERECFTGERARDPSFAESAELVDVIKRESHRINETVQHFLDVARPPRLAPRATDLAAFLSSVADAARPMAGARGLTLDIDVASTGEVVLDATQMRQALDNLLRNAIDATPPGGRVWLASRGTAREHVLEVGDTGRGIEPEVLPRIFDLYFTTKSDGTGIGLAVTQQIVTAHGGTLDVESTPGAGTVMRIYLPRTVVEATDARSPHPGR